MCSLFLIHAPKYLFWFGFFCVKQSLNKITQSLNKITQRALREETRAQMMTLPVDEGIKLILLLLFELVISIFLKLQEKTQKHFHQEQTIVLCTSFRKYNAHLTHLSLCKPLSQQHLKSWFDITLALMIIMAQAVPAYFSTINCLWKHTLLHITPLFR